MARDGNSFSNIGATTAAFNLLGGRYAVTCAATGAGTMGLQMLMPDGTTWLAVYTATAVATGALNIVELPPGAYRFQVTGFTAAYASISGIPQS